MRPIWVKGSATLASVGLQRALGGPALCHLGETPPPRKPAAVVVCCPEAGTDPDPVKVASEVGTVLEAAPEAAVVILGPSPDPKMARAAVRAGARGFLHAGMPPEQVVRAVSVAAKGEVVLPRELLKKHLGEERAPDLSLLSAQQWEVLELVAEGLSNAQIARRLYLSEWTVKLCLRRTYKLLDVKNRKQAAGLFRRSKWLWSGGGTQHGP